MCGLKENPLISILHEQSLYCGLSSIKVKYLNPKLDDTLPIKAHSYERFIAVQNVVLYHYSRYTDAGCKPSWLYHCIREVRSQFCNRYHFGLHGNTVSMHILVIGSEIFGLFCCILHEKSAGMRRNARSLRARLCDWFCIIPAEGFLPGRRTTTFCRLQLRSVSCTIILILYYTVLIFKT